jgi:CRISPR type IV-associated protein Csf3
MSDAAILAALGVPNPATFIPLRVTAHLQCGVISDTYLPLDAILHYQHMREALGSQIVTVPGETTPHGDIPDMQIAKRGTRPDWYFAASFAQWGVATDGLDHWNKRFDQQHGHLVDFSGKRGKVIVEQGAYKAYHMPVAYRHALTVTWYLVADQAWVTRLLAQTTHLGKKASQGWGAVLRWQIEPWHADWSERDDTGRLMRAIPQPGGVRYGIRPSYWLARNQVPCVLPNA